MTAAADIAALAERIARLEERADTSEKQGDDLQAQIRSVSNRLWLILVAVLATLLTVLFSAVKPG